MRPRELVLALKLALVDHARVDRAVLPCPQGKLDESFVPYLERRLHHLVPLSVAVFLRVLIWYDIGEAERLVYWQMQGRRFEGFHGHGLHVALLKGAVCVYEVNDR